MRTGFIIVALVVIGLIALTGAASASVASIMQTQGSVVALMVFGSVIAIAALALYRAMSAKKGHTETSRPGRFTRDMSTVLVLGMITVNARYAFTRIARATSPKVLTRAYGTNFDG